MDGLPKCSVHKASKPSKAAAGTGGAPSGASNQSFSYSANAGKGKVAGQPLTTIEASIAEQTAPAQLQLSQDPGTGKIFNPSTKIEFQQKADGHWLAVGVIEGTSTRKLTKMDVHICYANQWKWDTTCVEEESGLECSPSGHRTDDPLVNNSGGLVARKVDSITANNN